MKTYQVVKVSLHRAERNGKVIYSNGQQSTQEVMEVILNWYAEEGWTLSGFTASEGSNMYDATIFVAFEKEK